MNILNTQKVVLLDIEYTLNPISQKHNIIKGMARRYGKENVTIMRSRPSPDNRYNAILVAKIKLDAYDKYHNLGKK